MAGILLNRSRQVPAEDTPAFGGIAERFRRGGDLDRAIALCREGLKKFPDQLSARVTLGWSLLDKGEYDEARAELERVIRRAPDNLAAIRGLAELHDRSEGALTSMDGRDLDAESIAAAVPAAESVAPSAHVTAAPTPPPAPPADLFAPIPVTLASAKAQPSPEILHTADDAGRAAKDAALAAAALLGIEAEPVEVERPAAAAMAAAAPTPLVVTASEPADLDVDQLAVAAASYALDNQFDAGAATFDATPPVLTNPADLAVERADVLDGAVDLIVETGVIVETPAEWALSDASPTESFSVASFEPVADAAAEAEELVAALQSSDAGEEPGAQALMLDVPATDDDSVSLDVALTSLETELALQGDTAAFETLEIQSDAALLQVDASSEVAITPEPIASATSEFVASEVAELTELLSADQDVQSVLPTALEASADETVERPEAAVAFETIDELVEPAIVASLAETVAETSEPVMAVAADEVAPLTAVQEVVPETAVATDLSLAFESHDIADAADLLAGLPTQVALAGEAPTAPAVEDVVEPEFVPDLSSVTLEDAAFELQALTLEEVELQADEPRGEVFDARDLPPDPSANLAFHFEDRVPDVAIEPVVVDEAPSPVEIAEVGEAQDVAAVAAASATEEVQTVFVPMPEAEVQPGPQAELASEAEAEPIFSPFAALAAISSMPHPVVAISPAAERSAAVVTALERFLRQVQTRRLQLAAESVA